MARTFFPILKEAGWPHRELVVSMPLLPRADAPIVCFAEDLPNGYAFLTRQEAPQLDARAFLPEAVRNLQARPTDLAVLPSGVAMSGGKDLTAERLLDPSFLAAVHARLGPQIYVGVPHRVAIYAVSASASQQAMSTFVQMVRFETQNGPEQGHAPVSSLAFCIQNGQLLSAVGLDDVRPVAAAPAAPVAAPVAVAPAAPAPARQVRAGVRHPRDLVRVDTGTKTIELSVVLVGSGAKAFGRAMFTATGGAAPEPETRDELEHFVMRLPPIRDWTTRLFLYSLDASLASIGHASDLVSSADAVILVQSGNGPRLEPALFAMAKKAREGKRLLAFVGPQASLSELESEGRLKVDFTSDAGASAAIPVLKELTKAALASLRA